MSEKSLESLGWYCYRPYVTRENQELLARAETEKKEQKKASISEKVLIFFFAKIYQLKENSKTEV